MRDRNGSYSALKIGCFLNYIMSKESQTAIIILIIISIRNLMARVIIHVNLLFRNGSNISTNSIVTFFFKQRYDRKTVIFLDNTSACQIAQICFK